MTSSNKPVVGDHGSCDATQQDSIGSEVVAERRARLVHQPGVHTDSHNSRDVAPTSNVDKSRHESSQVTSCTDAIRGDVEQKLNIDEPGTDEDEAGSRSARGFVVQHAVHNL